MDIASPVASDATPPSPRVEKSGAIQIYGSRGFRSVVQGKWAPVRRSRSEARPPKTQSKSSGKSKCREGSHSRRSAVAGTPQTFLEADPQPSGLPHARNQPVRVIVAASGYIDYTTSLDTYSVRAAAAARTARASGMLSGAGASETDACEIIKCSDTFVQLNTTYTDSKRYMFHKVYGSTQPNDSVFAEVLPVVLDTTNGVNAHIIAYGQSGTGKTHLIEGSQDGQVPGILPRVLNELMSLREQLGLVISLSVYTVNSETATDLLTPSAMRTCGVEAAQVNSRIITSRASVNDVLLLDRMQALEILSCAVRQLHRKTSETLGATQHTIAQFIVERVTSDGTGLQGVLTVADLCGYDAGQTAKKSPVQQTLLNVGRLVRARCNGEFVAASSCLLTRILHDSFGGNGRTVLIATVSCMQRDLKATLHTLNLGRQAMAIRDQPKFNFANRKDTPHLGRGKSRSGQNISLVLRFMQATRVMRPLGPRCIEDPVVLKWKRMKPVITVDPKPEDTLVRKILEQSEFRLAVAWAADVANVAVASEWMKSTIGYTPTRSSPTASEEALEVEMRVEALLHRTVDDRKLETATLARRMRRTPPRPAIQPIDTAVGDAHVTFMAVGNPSPVASVRGASTSPRPSPKASPTAQGRLKGSPAVFESEQLTQTLERRALKDTMMEPLHSQGPSAKLDHLRFVVPYTEDPYYDIGIKIIKENGGEVCGPEPVSWSRAIAIGPDMRSLPGSNVINPVAAAAQAMGLPSVTWDWLHQIIGGSFSPPARDVTATLASVNDSVPSKEVVHGAVAVLSGSSESCPSPLGGTLDRAFLTIDPPKSSVPFAIVSMLSAVNEDDMWWSTPAPADINPSPLDCKSSPPMLPLPAMAHVPLMTIEEASPVSLNSVEPLLGRCVIALAVNKAMAQEVTSDLESLGASIVPLVDAVKMCAKGAPKARVIVVTSERVLGKLPSALRKVAAKGYCELVQWEWVQELLQQKVYMLPPTERFCVRPEPAGKLLEV